MTAVGVDELGPEVTAARIELATPAGPEHITARLLDGLAMAITSGAPIRVADAVMDRLAVPAGTGQGGPTPEQTERDLRIDLRPRYEPRYLTFAVGLHHWVLGGSFTENTLQSHWQDYDAAADHGTAVLSSAVAQPEGFAWLAQEIYAPADHLGEFQSATAAMADAGVLVDSGPLQPPETATTVRVRDGEIQLSDGPFAEIKEQLGGYYILDCADLDTALRYAAMIPSARYGSVEVRPVMVMGPH